ncbi:LamG domain-containing protein [Variovorax sp.]|jgi:hypothetical protein|uniref:LamG domain-containing protein n=1 Tax=Variovorax sp. TaxID=1871043 RepID=UPI0037DA4282
MAAGDITAAQTLAGVSQTAAGLVGVARVPGPVDTFASSNAALLHLDGANGSTTFTDLAGHTFTGVGSAALSTAQKKFGTASLFLNGTTQYIQSPYSADWDMPGDFTAEMWFYANSIANSPVLVDRWNSFGWQLSIGSNGRASLLLQNSGGTVFVLSPVPGGPVPMITVGEWHHIAVTRSGNTARLFVDGLLHGSSTFTGALPAVTTADLYIGCQNASLNFFSGYLDEIRFTKGVARYVSDFVPSEVPFGTPDTTLAQRLSGVTQTATGIVTAAADRSFNAAQTLDSVAQAATAVELTKLTATQSLEDVSQGATAAAQAKTSAAQTLAGVAQAATAVITGASGSFSGAQTLEGAAQAAAAAAIARASAGQVLDGVSQGAAAGAGARVAAAQTLDAAVGAATAIVVASAQAAQTLGAVAQVATGTVTDTIRHLVGAQLLAGVLQVARVRHAYAFERNERTVRVIAEDRGIRAVPESRRVAIVGERRAVAFTD